MAEAPHRIRPKSLNDYLEVMSKAVFQSGMSWKVVEAKWPGIREGFHGFDVDRVADMSEDELDRLAENPQVIRNRKKLGAVAHNAARLQTLDAQPGGFRGFLRAEKGFEERLDRLNKEFKFLGDMGAYYFLYVVGERVPPHEESVERLAKRKR
ncbi:MAG: DNA-3-methyladenine glycosylase I [Vicinamibacteria bacterium]